MNLVTKQARRARSALAALVLCAYARLTRTEHRTVPVRCSDCGRSDGECDRTEAPGSPRAHPSRPVTHHIAPDDSASAWRRLVEEELSDDSSRGRYPGRGGW